MVDPYANKQCPKCKRWFIRKEGFYRNKAGTRSFRTYCKECEKAMPRVRRRTHQVSVRISDSTWEDLLVVAGAENSTVHGTIRAAIVSYVRTRQRMVDGHHRWRDPV